MTLQDIIAIAFKKYPEKYEIVIHGEPMDYTGMNMDDFEEDINDIPRRCYIFGYADALGIYASHINVEIYRYKQSLKSE